MNAKVVCEIIMGVIGISGLMALGFIFLVIVGLIF